MMSNAKPTATKDRPFPWLCIECGKREIYPRPTDFRSTELHDGTGYEIHIPDLEIPTCRNCGEQRITIKVDDRIFAALRAEAGLLTPNEIERKREELGLSQKNIADLLKLPEETLARVEAGRWIQSRAVDDQLRSFFNRSAPSTNGSAAIGAANELPRCMT